MIILSPMKRVMIEMVILMILTVILMIILLLMRWGNYNDINEVDN